MAEAYDPFSDNDVSRGESPRDETRKRKRRWAPLQRDRSEFAPVLVDNGNTGKLTAEQQAALDKLKFVIAENLLGMGIQYRGEETTTLGQQEKGHRWR